MEKNSYVFDKIFFFTKGIFEKYWILRKNNFRWFIKSISASKIVLILINGNSSEIKAFEDISLCLIIGININIVSVKS